MKSVRRPRRLALVVAAAGLALSVSGCAYFNPMQTHDFYQAADGTNSSPDGVGVRNAVLVVDQEGNGQLFVSVVNETSEDAVASLRGTYEGTDVFSAEIPVAAGGVVQIGSEQEATQQIPVTGSIAKPGDIMQLTISSGENETTISLPVMNDSLGYFPSDGGQG